MASIEPLVFPAANAGLQANAPAESLLLTSPTIPHPHTGDTSAKHVRRVPPKRYGGASSMSTEMAMEAALEIQQILSKTSATHSMPALPPSSSKTPVLHASASMPSIASPKPTGNVITVVAQRPPSVNGSPAVPAVINLPLRRTNMSSPVPVKIGVPIKIGSYDVEASSNSNSNDKGDSDDDASGEYSSSSESIDDDLTSSESDLDEAVEEDYEVTTVFASSPRSRNKFSSKQVMPSRMPKLGQSLSNLHAPLMDEAAKVARPLPIQEEDENDDEDYEVTPPARIPNPVPRNSPFWDRTNVNGAELGLLSIATHALFGEDEDRALRRLRVLGMPLPPPPASAMSLQQHLEGVSAVAALEDPLPLDAHKVSPSKPLTEANLQSLSMSPPTLRIPAPSSVNLLQTDSLKGSH